MVKGLDRLKAQNAERLAKMKAVAFAQTKQVADEHLHLMRPLIPVDEAELIKSAKVKPIGNEGARAMENGTVVLGHAVEYGDETTIVTNGRGARFQNARIQEFGTATRQANPAMYPTYRANKRRFKARIAKALRLAAKHA